MSENFMSEILPSENFGSLMNTLFRSDFCFGHVVAERWNLNCFPNTGGLGNWLLYVSPLHRFLCSPSKLSVIATKFL